MFKPSILFFTAHHYGYCYGRDSLDAGHWLSPLVKYVNLYRIFTRNIRGCGIKYLH